MKRYTIRYRWTDRAGQVALIVDDGRGTAYLVSDGRLQARLAGDDASGRLARLLAGRGTWAPVPEASPHTLDGLHRLTAAPASRDRSRGGLEQDRRHGQPTAERAALVEPSAGQA